MKELQLMVLQKLVKSKKIKYLHLLTVREEKLKLLQL
jgi:pyruvate kinase